MRGAENNLKIMEVSISTLTDGWIDRNTGRGIRLVEKSTNQVSALGLNQSSVQLELNYFVNYSTDA